ncbi:MAG: CPBP family intramembrane metalloprotease [Deltaproteobacteria bacterium]|nr:CPBP family intramembrane metalloprotease [Deltaproteobacteria bacterium]
MLLFAIFVHLTTSGSPSSSTFVGSAFMVLIAIGLCSKRFVKVSESARSLWTPLTALATGFWSFSFFRFTGFVEWPLGRAVDLAGYARLLYFHIILSASVLTPVIIIGHITAQLNRVYWGNWWKGGFSLISLKIVLWLTLFGIWVWALSEVLSVKPDTFGPAMGLLAISILKAILTGATEEICYRGIIQPAAIARFGVALGIVLQSCLYTAFHMHLGEIFFGHTGFLAGVMTLGLVFGIVTRLSGGIGWAFVVHTAINLVIEWRNIS